MSVLRGRRGGGRLFAQLPFALVMAIVVIAGLRIWMYHWRQGSALIAGALLVAAVLRAVLTSEQAGLLVVRGRVVDVLTYAGLGLVIFTLALMLGEIPFW